MSGKEGKDAIAEAQLARAEMKAWERTCNRIPWIYVDCGRKGGK